MTTKHTFAEIQQAVAVNVALRDALMASTPRPLVFERRNLGPLLVSRCPTKLGQWRVTAFDKDNKSTDHMEAADFPAAIRNAIYMDGDPGTVRECLVATC